jgi:hypothetical protein
MAGLCGRVTISVPLSINPLFVNVVARSDQAPPKRDKQDHADQEVHHERPSEIIRPVGAQPPI